MEIKIMSISDLLNISYLKNSYRVAIMFISEKPDYYDFGFTWYYKANIADTDTPIISKWTRRMLEHIIENADDIDILYICCDAGISRSPAIGYFIAHKINEIDQATNIKEKYPYLNWYLVRKLKETSWK